MWRIGSLLVVLGACSSALPTSVNPAPRASQSQTTAGANPDPDPEPERQPEAPPRPDVAEADAAPAAGPDARVQTATHAANTVRDLFHVGETPWVVAGMPSREFLLLDASQLEVVQARARERRGERIVSFWPAARGGPTQALVAFATETGYGVMTRTVPEGRRATLYRRDTYGEDGPDLTYMSYPRYFGLHHERRLAVYADERQLIPLVRPRRPRLTVAMRRIFDANVALDARGAVSIHQSGSAWNRFTVVRTDPELAEVFQVELEIDWPARNGDGTTALLARRPGVTPDGGAILTFELRSRDATQLRVVRLDSTGARIGDAMDHPIGSRDAVRPCGSTVYTARLVRSGDDTLLHVREHVGETSSEVHLADIVEEGYGHGRIRISCTDQQLALAFVHGAVHVVTLTRENGRALGER